MSKFTVTKREVWTSAIEIEAEDEAQALRLVSEGLGEELDGSLEYSHDLGVDNWTVELDGDEIERENQEAQDLWDVDYLDIIYTFYFANY